MSIITSPEMFINIKSQPKWIEGVSFDEQPVSTQQFWEEELKKILFGVTINGVKMHPWLYFYINFWKMFSDVEDSNGVSRRIPITTQLRDNEWYIQENLFRAEEERKGIFMFGTRRSGKALSNNELLRYVDGWKPIGSAKVGDKIYGCDGKLTEVIGVYPWDRIKMYKVTFDDGRSIECCEDHLWEVFDYQSRCVKTLPLKEILKRKWKFQRVSNGNQYKDGKDRIKDVYNFYIPVNKPMDFDKKDLPLDPYFIGLYLGDGCKQSSTIVSEDKEIIDYYNNYIEKEFPSLYVESKGLHHRARIKNRKENIYNDVCQLLKKLDIYEEKKIPDIYMNSCIEDRISLLQGLMDSDGHCSNGGYITFCQTNKMLMDQVYELCLSLGINCHINEKITNYRYIGTRELAKTNILTMFPKFNVFRLSRKAERFNENLRCRTNRDYVAIVNIESIENDKGTCIRVDNNDSLFVTSNYIVTHNSSFESSFCGHSASTKEGGANSIVCGGRGDLGIITSYIDYGLKNLPEFFRFSIIGSNWEKGVQLCTKYADGSKDIWSEIQLINVDGGELGSTEKTAGPTPVCSIYDEVGKYPVEKIYLAAMPSFERTDGKGFRFPPIMVGCLTAGNKVFNSKGELINIEDITKESGIIGFDQENGIFSNEDITYIQDPLYKECVEITTRTGRKIECSLDHPILFKNRNKWDKNNNRVTEFKAASEFNLGDHICVIDNYPLKGLNSMWNPRLVGMLIGDGSYGYNKNPLFSNCDNELNDYIYNNFDCIQEKSHITKNEKVYKETRIRGICKYLRELGIYGQTGKDKRLPLNIHSYLEKDICDLLSGLFDTDGCIQFNENGRNINVSLCSCSEEMLHEVMLLFQRLGIHGSVNIKKANILDSRKDKNDWFVYQVSDRKSLLIFYDKIKLLVSYKQEKLDSIYNYMLSKKNKIDRNDNGFRIEKIVSIKRTGVKRIYNLTANNTHTYLANGIITHNTGGEVELSEDAQKMINNPELYKMILMDWSLLEKRYPTPTWKRKDKWGVFIPAQMSTQEGCVKNETTLDKYLGIKDAPGLSQVNILVTDFETSTKNIKKRLKELRESGNTTAYNKYKMYTPLDPDDCFLVSGKSPFNTTAALEHKSNLIASGKSYKTVKLGQSNGYKLIMEDDDESPLARYPFDGGNIESPAVIYEDPPEDNDFNTTYVSGLDPYKHKKAETDSIGAFYVFKRQININDPFANRIVASYCSRPANMDDFHQNCMFLQEGYGAMCLMENFDISYEEYLRFRMKEFRLLEEGETIAQKNIFSRAKQNNKFGLTPNQRNQEYLLRLAVQYVNEIIDQYKDEKGREVIVYGVVRIPDPYLLDEIISYRPGKNCDRIVAFGHTLALARYYDLMGFTPNNSVNAGKKENEEHKKNYQESKTKSFYNFGRRGFFK